MKTTKCWQMRIKGQRSADEIQSAVGKNGGLLLRIHSEGKRTDVYFAADKATARSVAKGTKAAGAAKEVRAARVTKLT